MSLNQKTLPFVSKRRRVIYESEDERETKGIEKVVPILRQAGFGKQNINMLLHEMKYFRNHWAHEKVFNDRLCSRLLDTSELLLEYLKVPKDSPFYKKIYNSRLNVLAAHLSQAQKL